MRTLVLPLALLANFVSPAFAWTGIAVLPSNFQDNPNILSQQFAEAIIALGPDDQLLVFSAAPLTQLAEIKRPVDPGLNNARLKAKLGQQFVPVRDYLDRLPKLSAGDPPSSLMVPDVVDEIARNIIPRLPDKRADILLIGSLNHVDRRDQRWSMVDRFYPSDGLLSLARSETPFGLANAKTRLGGSTVTYCYPGTESEFVTSEHEEQVRRFWSLWTVGQSARGATFSRDLATCFRNFRAGGSSGQPVYRLRSSTKPEMLRARAPLPLNLPTNYSQPGEYFLRDDVAISKTPPAKTTGIAWIGLKWSASCDVDLYARPDASGRWLYFGDVRSDDGYFNKDFRSGTEQGQYEYIEFIRAIDLTKAEVAINLYEGDLPAGPEGVVRMWFDGKVYEAPFKLVARAGNKGARPMTGPNWIRVDLRKVVGLPSS